MNLSDLLGLLREEFALDIPATREALARAAAQPHSAVHELQAMQGFLERSMEVSTLVGLAGFGGFLQQIHEFTQAQMRAPNADALTWLAHWPDPALAYLEQPAQEQSTQAVLDYLQLCPQPVDSGALEALGALLSAPPALSAEEQAAADEPLPEATPADVSLATDDVDAGLLSAMLMDAPEQLEKLFTALQGLGTGAATPEQLVEAQRIAHTFKGSGNIIGLPGIGRIAHRRGIVDHQGLALQPFEQMRAGDVGEIERRVLPHQHDVDVFHQVDLAVLAHRVVIASDPLHRHRRGPGG